MRINRKTVEKQTIRLDSPALRHRIKQYAPPEPAQKNVMPKNIHQQDVVTPTVANGARSKLEDRSRIIVEPKSNDSVFPFTLKTNKESKAPEDQKQQQATKIQASTQPQIPRKPQKAQLRVDHLEIAKRFKGFKEELAVEQEKSVQKKTIGLDVVSRVASTSQDVFNDLHSTWNLDPIKRGLSRIQKAFYMVGVFVIGFSLFVSIQTFITNTQTRQQVLAASDRQEEVVDDQGVPQGTGNEPSEAEVPESAVRNFVPANPEHPRYLRIPELNVFSRVTQLGLTDEGAVDAPKNIYDVGWYEKSSLPGEDKGSSLLLGHVSGWTAPGVFKHVGKLSPGSVFEVEKGTGEIIKYEVTKTATYSLQDIDMARILSAEDPNAHDLKLMTCSGAYNQETETYEDRLVVYSKVIQ